MIKHLLTIVITFSFITASAQDNRNLMLKKRNKVIDNFWKGTIIAFQLKDKTWWKGNVTSIKKDSIYIKPLMIQYSFLRADTIPSFITGFAIKDIYAFPKPGIWIDYNNGSFYLNKRNGHVQAYWIKSGWIFRAGALGYAALNIINSASDGDFSLSNNGTQLGIAAGVFALGVLLKKTYKPVHRVGKKYHLEVLDLSPQ